MLSKLIELTKDKNTIIKISFWNLYGFHLINDSKGKHYIYLHSKDKRIEDKLNYFSQFGRKFTIIRGMTNNNTLNAYIQFKCNEHIFDIIERFLLKFILCSIDESEINKYFFRVNVKNSIKTDKNNYKKWLKSHRNGYIPLQ